MKSNNAGRSWENKGIFIEDLNPRMILKPHNTSNTFVGGVGDPSAVANGDYLYLFYGEYGYPDVYDEQTYQRKIESSGQCISMARIALKDLDNPQGKAKRWDGKGFNAPFNGIELIRRKKSTAFCVCVIRGFWIGIKIVVRLPVGCRNAGYAVDAVANILPVVCKRRCFGKKAAHTNDSNCICSRVVWQ